MVVAIKCRVFLPDDQTDTIVNNTGGVENNSYMTE
jgi:hypothetical protein